MRHTTAKIIGVNNRDLRTFNVDLKTTLELVDDVPAGTRLVTESGIHTAADVALMRSHHVMAFLVGETLMRADDPGAKLKELFGG